MPRIESRRRHNSGPAAVMSPQRSAAAAANITRCRSPHRSLSGHERCRRWALVRAEPNLSDLSDAVTCKPTSDSIAVRHQRHGRKTTVQSGLTKAVLMRHPTSQG